jgi:hypothetical protein
VKIAKIDEIEGRPPVKIGKIDEIEGKRGWWFLARTAGHCTEATV